MTLRPIAATLLTLSLLATSIALPVQAAPQPPEDMRQQDHRAGNPQSRPTAAQHARPPAQQTQRQQPPKDFSAVHQAFHERRAQIGAGPALPPGIQIQAGKRLPNGYGKRLDAHALQGLPHYSGYEWRRVGSDMVLVTITTGIVFTVLQGVLR